MPDPRPNILLILADQMRGDALSITGHPVVETPNLDALARRGTVFTAAYSSCPSCIAARASIFTGLTPSTHGRLGYRDKVPWRYDNMLPDVLGRAGYQTYCIGKTHFYPQRMHGGFQGLESYEGAQNLDGNYVNDYWEWLAERTGGRLQEFDHGVDSNSWVARPSHLPEELHNNTWVVTRAIEFLRRQDRTRPFFLNLSFHRPHPPIDPPAAFFDMYRDKPLPPVPVGDWAAGHAVPPANVNCWQAQLPQATLDRCRRGYYAQIAHIDNQIGRLMMSMRTHHIGPTWIIFTSDHGEMLGDHNLFRKVYAYEGSARVPFIIAPPRHGAESPCDAPIVLEDVYPTCLEIAGLPIAESVEGRSAVRFALKDGQAIRREFVHGEHAACYHESLGVQFLTDGKEKYVWYTLSGREQLFDLRNDPQELRDLAPVASSHDRLELWRNRLIARLAQRPQDNLSDGRQLLPGHNLPPVRQELMVEGRHSERSAAK